MAFAQSYRCTVLCAIGRREEDPSVGNRNMVRVRDSLVTRNGLDTLASGEGEGGPLELVPPPWRVFPHQ